jgi:limonene-1,2-epoxide hydrolase
VTRDHGRPVTTGSDPAAVVERYLSAVVEHDWDTLGGCVAPDVVRVGPFGDTYEGRADYIAFLADLMPRLAGYAMRVDRVLATGGVVSVELTETVTMDGSTTDTAESLVFDVGDDGAITRIAIYIRRPAPTA